MHYALEGHSSPFKFWVTLRKWQIFSAPLFLISQKFPGLPLKWERGADTMKCICISYNWQLTTATDFITISVRFFQQVNFNNSNPLSVQWCLWAQIKPLEYILNYTYHHFELPRREPKAIFDSMIGWYLLKKKKKIFFGTGSVTSTENLKS